jgi:hypothetical protein
MNVFNIEERFEICKKCPIYEPNKQRCNSNLWINPDTNQISTTYKNGYVRGCGCYISVKAKNRNNHCIAGKW